MSNDYIWHEIAQEVRDAPAHYGTVGAYMSTSHLSIAEDTEAKKAEAIEQMRQIMDSAEPGQYRFATTMGQLGAPTTTLLFMGEDRMLYIARRPGINLVEYNGGLNITVRSDLADWAAYQAYETIKERVNAAAIASGGLDGLPEEPATVARLLGGCA